MKIGVFTLLLAVAIVFAGCSGQTRSSVAASKLQRIQSNNMDFPDTRSEYYNGVRFELSELFESSYYDRFVLSGDYMVKAIEDLNIYFSMEFFSVEDAEGIRYKFEDEEDLSLMDAVHDNYTIKRNASLDEATISIKKPVPGTVGFPGVMQTISGTYDYYDEPNIYFMATLDLKDQIVVIQLIGKKENMGYLYDDFIDIISSVSL